MARAAIEIQWHDALFPRLAIARWQNLFKASMSSLCDRWDRAAPSAAKSAKDGRSIKTRSHEVKHAFG
jgi:hypothetical protein